MRETCGSLEFENQPTGHLYSPARTAPRPANTLAAMAITGPMPTIPSPITVTPARAALLVEEVELVVELAWLEVMLVFTPLVTDPVPELLDAPLVVELELPVVLVPLTLRVGVTLAAAA